MNIKSSGVKLFVANVAGAGADFLGVVIFSRELGASVLGTFFLFQALIGIVAIPTNFGLRDAVEKRISEGTDREAFLAAAVVTKIFPITLIISGILIFRSSINQYLGAKLAVLMIFVLLFKEYAQLSLSVLRGELRVGETAILKFTQRFSWLLVGVLLVQLGYGVESLVYALLLGYVVLFFWGWRKVSIFPDIPTFDHVRSLFDYSRYSVISSVGGYFYNWMDVALIGLFLTQEHVGAYEISWRVTMVVMLFSRALATTIFPQVSQWDAEEFKDYIESLIPAAMTYSMILVVPAFFGTLVFSKQILLLVFEVSLDWAWLALIILMGEKVLQSVHLIIGRSLQAIDRPDLAAYATIVSVIVNLILNLLLISRFGIVGAAIGTTVSFAINTALHAYYLTRFLEITMPYIKLSWIIVSAAGMLIVVSTVSVLFSIQSILELTGAIMLGVIVYTGTTLLFRPLRIDIFQAVRSVAIESIRGS